MTIPSLILNSWPIIMACFGVITAFSKLKYDIKNVHKDVARMSDYIDQKIEKSEIRYDELSKSDRFLRDEIIKLEKRQYKSLDEVQEIYKHIAERLDRNSERIDAIYNAMVRKKD